jgi:hypothetical protein
MTIQTTHLESKTQKPATRHFIILPTHHEDVLRLKDKLLAFQNHGWKVRDFGAFGAFDCGFLVIEIHDLEEYHAFKRDMCSLIEQGLKYVYPEHIVCWL